MILPTNSADGSPRGFSPRVKPCMAFLAVVLVACPNSRAEEGVAFSSLFTTDTRWGLGLGSRESRTFSVDTRLSGSASDAASGLFTVDTTGASVGDATIVGRVTDTTVAGLEGATVVAIQSGVVCAQAVTISGGYYAIQSLPEGVYDTRATKTDYLTGFGYGLNLPAAGVKESNLQLAAKPAAPVVVPVDRPPESYALGAIGTDHLKVYANGAFHPYGAIDRSKMTVVFTHGWNSNPNVWATNMVAQMILGGFNNANFVAWDWSNAAASSAPAVSWVAGRTPRQGEALGVALAGALGSTYGRPIHLIGHSFGTLVNAEAANYLHKRTGGAFPPSLTHVTLLDEGEVGAVGNNTWRLFDPGLSMVWPVPESFAWMDSYISFVGLSRRFWGVDVVLQQSIYRVPATLDYYQRIQDLHGYAAVWYAKSAANPSGSLLGFSQSFERNGPSWSPASTAPRRGSGYAQGLTTPELTVAEISAPEQGAMLGALAAFNSPSVIVGALQGTAQAAGNVALDVVEAIVANIAPEQPGYVSTPMFAGDVGLQDLSIYSPQATLLSAGGLGGAPPPQGLRSQRRDLGASTNAPCIWLTTSVPADAAVFMFDFSFEGSPGDDIISASIGGTNVFALEARYVPTNEPFSSGPIPVEVFAGQTVEFFFGLLGGTSSNASVVINAMRFYSIPPPALTIAATGGASVVTWPGSALDYNLEAASSLGNSAVWSAVTNEPVLEGLQNVVTNEVAAGSRFYRLRKR